MCEDPKKIYYADESVGQVNDTPGIDLRGWYRPQGKRLFVEHPEDIVRHGLRVPEHAVAATPGWGEIGLQRYRDAITVFEVKAKEQTA